jgi:hypothetical protein
VGLNGIAVICAIVYTANAFHYGWGPASRTTLDDLLEWLTAAVLLALYWAGYKKLLMSEGISFAKVMLPVIPLVAISFFTIPYDSSDVFLYMDAGWAQAHYGLNPYSHTLRDVPNVAGDPIIQADWMQNNKNPWLDLPFVYGFFFALLAKAMAWLGRGNWWLTLSLFKSLNVAAYFVCCRLVWRLSKGVGALRPDVSLYLFAWSPLILQHHIANAHNDLLVGCLVIIAVSLATSRLNHIWAPAVLAGSAMIKYLTLPLVPLSIWWIGRKHGWRHAVLAGILTVSVIVLFSSLYIGEFAAFRFDNISAQVTKTTAGSLFAFVFYIYRFLGRFVISPASIETFGLIMKILLWSIGAVTMAAVTYRFCRRPEPSFDEWIATCCSILMAIIFIASSQFYSWYIGMFFPVVLLLRADHWLRTFSIVLSGTHVFSLTSLSRKGVGYFLLTLIPLLKTWRTRWTY